MLPFCFEYDLHSGCSELGGGWSLIQLVCLFPIFHKSNICLDEKSIECLENCKSCQNVDFLCSFGS